MEISVTRIADVVLLRLVGDFKARKEFAAIFWSHFHRGRSKFLLNFDGVRAINSHGLQALLEFNRLAEAAGGALRLCGVSDGLTKVFKAARVIEVFAIREDEDTALVELLGGLPTDSDISTISRYRN